MNDRKPDYKIDNLFIRRWSPRAMSGEVTDKELNALFEAARWAPSSYNAQPWRFIYAKKGTKYWNTFLDLLVDFNKSWAANASVLVLVVSRKTFEHNNNSSVTHSFDAGAAWENLALQGSLLGLVVHGMEGFDYKKAKEVAGIPDNYNVEAMIAIGRPGRKEDLPKELQERETPSGRKPISEFVFEGRYKEKAMEKNTRT